MAVVGFHHLEELFRQGASLDIKKGHAKEVTDIVEQKLYDLLLMGQKTAKYNGRDVIWKYDLPITKGLEETINEFRKLEQELEIKDIIDRLATYPPLLELEVELEKFLPELVGGLTLVLARIMKKIEEENRAVSHEMIKHAKEIMDLTL
ncbi:DUF1931 family protein [Nitrosophilus alvini]|uniref:DUF1931 family protein n=1 Tax=Nitrosophilus alvini TaxID=2714855 RepID=UPI00190C1801|nr:DUF1931 family protein [Nitrosophilus alvini]